jgi:pimeloyl-ACP methyl ester carboxylesterase
MRIGQLGRALVQLLAPAAITLGALGAAHGAGAAGKPVVIFFGGYTSTGVDMQNWLAAVRNSSHGKDFTFEAVPYPAIDSPVEADAVKAAAATIDAKVREIRAAPDTAFIVVGHSSSASTAARVVEQLPNRRNIKLVILDDGVDEGFVPPAGFDPKTQVECWSVVNGTLHSFNRGPTMAFCRNYHEIQAPACRTEVCLHFAIVNQGAAADLTEQVAFSRLADGSTGGYRNLKPVLVWLDSSVGF